MHDDLYRPPESDVVRRLDPDQVELASRWRRLFGFLLDSVIASVLTVPFMFTSGYFVRAMENSVDAAEPFMWGGVGAVIYVIVNGYTLHKRGQTLGKMMVATQIVSATDRRLLPLWKVFLLRWLFVGMLTSIPYAGLPIAIINIALIFANDRRCGHDHIAGTIVIDYVAPENLPRR